MLSAKHTNLRINALYTDNRVAKRAEFSQYTDYRGPEQQPGYTFVFPGSDFIGPLFGPSLVLEHPIQNPLIGKHIFFRISYEFNTKEGKLENICIG